MTNNEMISVSHLTKRFASGVAVDDVSFDVRRGEIAGFLGPNGAGKTTTMRILTGYIPATGGEVKVADRNVFSQSLEVRKRIGYLPENCPLYGEMRVDEYLKFRARLKGLSRARLRHRVSEVKELCGLEDVGKRIIGQLSKGYRQRVGLAEALVHEPELLILDEPTIGLDPNQIRQVRELIRELATRHTILLSTHILSEVEMTCRRVLIIHKGRIVASDTPEKLRHRLRGGGGITAEIRGPIEELEPAIEALSGVERVVVTPDGEWNHCRIEVSGHSDPRTEIFALASQKRWMLRELHLDRRSLEDVFVELTRDEAGGGP